MGTPATMGASLSVSVIVPTYNRSMGLKRLLLMLEEWHSRGANIEVVVTVDGARDDTEEVIRSLRPGYELKTIIQPNRGPAAARNRAIGAAQGTILLFLDDDVIPIEGLLDKHLRIHEQDADAVVIGPMLPPPESKLAPWLQWEAATLQKQYVAMEDGVFAPTFRQFYTANSSVRREHVLAAGGFDERFKRAEDIELAQRLADRGMQFYFVPDAAVLHEPDRTFEAWLRVAYEYGRHAVLMDRCRKRESVALAFRELRERPAFTKLLLHGCVGRSRSVRALAATFGSFIRYTGPGSGNRVQHALCSALYCVQYWQGVADSTGLGAGLWLNLRGTGGSEKPVPRS